MYDSGFNDSKNSVYFSKYLFLNPLENLLKIQLEKFVNDFILTKQNDYYVRAKL
jgi:hypothetical protein